MSLSSTSAGLIAEGSGCVTSPGLPEVVKDACGVCGRNNETCVDCNNEPNGGKKRGGGGAWDMKFLPENGQT